MKTVKMNKMKTRNT